MRDSSASRVFGGIHEEISLTSVEPSTRATVFWRFICSQCFFGGGGGKLPHNAGTGVPGDGSVHCAVCRLPRDDPSHRTTGSKCSSAHSCAKETMCAAAWGADVHSAGLLRHPFVHVPFAFVHKCTPIPPPRVFLPVFTFFFSLCCSRRL